MSDEQKKQADDAQALGIEYGGGHAFLPEQLVEGYESFLLGRFEYEQGRFNRLAEKGQKPKVLLIGCADSRVSPARPRRWNLASWGSRWSILS